MYILNVEDQSNRNRCGLTPMNQRYMSSHRIAPVASIGAQMALVISRFVLLFVPFQIRSVYVASAAMAKIFELCCWNRHILKKSSFLYIYLFSIQQDPCNVHFLLSLKFTIQHACNTAPRALSDRKRVWRVSDSARTWIRPVSSTPSSGVSSKSFAACTLLSTDDISILKRL